MRHDVLDKLLVSLKANMGLQEIILLLLIIVVGLTGVLAVFKGQIQYKKSDVGSKSESFPRFKFTIRSIAVTIMLLVMFTIAGICLIHARPGSNLILYQFFCGCFIGTIAVYANAFRRGERVRVDGFGFRKYFHPVEAWLVIIGSSQATGALLALIFLRIVGDFLSK